MSKTILISWIGANDLKACAAEDAKQTPGPIAATLQAESFDSVELIYNYPEERVRPYLEWLQGRVTVPIKAAYAKLSSPVNFGEIYVEADKHLARQSSDKTQISILLSPGTPAMQAVWILLGKTKYPCSFYQSSLEQGVEKVDIPFELSAEYIPPLALTEKDFGRLSEAGVPVNAAFNDIITRNPLMQTLKSRAQVLSEHDVPVLIYGETGTGKELFARAIHNASKRSKGPFIPVNCGAIPPELVDSVLFGHKKGAFTGAATDKPGVFERADGGTLFLDEFGELEPNVQVRLLRVLQEGTYTPVGGTVEKQVDVRLVAATHRNLMELVAEGRFREDLFYRVAVGVLHLPPIRERQGDLTLLVDSLMQSFKVKGLVRDDKEISSSAKNLIFKHAWKGNVRELQSTLMRAVLWSSGEAITATDIQQALFEMPIAEDSLLARDISQGIDIKEIIGQISADYIRRAMDYTGHNKKRAAELLGFKNYQTLNNWMEKYNIS